MASQSRCALCDDEFGDKAVTSLGEKASATINTISANRGDSFGVSSGQTVHQQCRKNYLLGRNTLLKYKPGDDKQKIFLRSDTVKKFNFQTDCLFCGETTERDLKHLQTPKKAVIPVRTKSFQETIVGKAIERNDEWGKDVLSRIEYSQDLVASDAIYHQKCSVRFRNVNTDQETPVKRLKVGRKVSDEKEKAFYKVVQFIESNDSKQLILDELVDIMRAQLDAESEPFSNKHLKRRLIEHFGDRIFITETCGKSNVVTLHAEASKLIENCYAQSNSDSNETKKTKIIKTAAKLIKGDIERVATNLATYPASDEIEDVEKCVEYIPESLRMLLDILVSGKGTTLKKASLGQAIMQSARPISLLAPLQFGLAVQLHQLFGSKMLISTLNELGFCASYFETQRYEKCAAMTQTYDIPPSTGNRCMQFIADNVDHNIRSIDGLNTFHGMGMMVCVTPGITHSKVIPRINVSSADIAAVGKIQITFKDPVQGIPTTFSKLPESIVDDKTYSTDVLWKMSWLLRPNTPQWNGTMQMVQRGPHPGVSTTMFLPMIDMDPSNESCVYSTLSFVTNMASKYDVDPVLTFDQPLWYKAQMIVDTEPSTSSLKRIVCRLGGLHIQMSFIGAIGTIMTDSGLKELLETVYAENVVPHIMSGKAISRAIRGHFLAETALCSMITAHAFCTDIPNSEVEESSYVPTSELIDMTSVEMEDITNEQSCLMDEELMEIINEHDRILSHTASNDLAADDERVTNVVDTESGMNTEDEDGDNVQLQLKEAMKQLDSLLAGEVDVESIENLTEVQQAIDTMKTTISNMKRSRTAQLWFEYLEMLDILKMFIKGERTGDWLLHLQSILNMLPYFAATGHNAYTKSAYIYLNKMLRLPVTHPNVHKQFMEGMHVIRRSDRYWAGLSTDLVIEQMLMRSVKTVGGLTRGRGMDEVQRALWILSRPACLEINYKLQELTGQRYESSEQHKECGMSRKNKDSADVRKMIGYLVERNPFAEEDELRSIASGVVAGENVNVDKGREVGMDIVRDMEGKNVADFKFSKKAQVVTMSDSACVKIGSEEVKIDPQLLFQRLITAAQGAVPIEDLRDFFAYELCTYPPALFESTQLLRQANKSVLGQEITKHTVKSERSCEHFETKYVIDGGCLIQKLTWPRGRSYNELCEMYVKYVTDKYPNSHVVFDGYADGPSTKDNTHRRRTGGRMGAEVRVQGDLLMNTKKQSFLMNKANKQAFIDLLAIKLEEAGVDVTKAKGDADYDIVMTAVDYTKSINTVVVGEDTDLLVLLCFHAEDHGFTVHLTSEGRKKKYVNIFEVQERLGAAVCENILFLHAFLGCDTVSKPYGVGKVAALKLFNKSEKFQKCAQEFNKLPHETSKELIKQNGESAVILLYGDSEINSINSLRMKTFLDKTARNTLSVDPKTLPPTASATAYHSLRTYVQILQWKGLENDPCDYGWVLSNGNLHPKLTDMLPAPANILKVVRCGCKSGCRSLACSCRKLGLKCSLVCRNCDEDCCNQPEMLEFPD